MASAPALDAASMLCVGLRGTGVPGDTRRSTLVLFSVLELLIAAATLPLLAARAVLLALAGTLGPRSERHGIESRARVARLHDARMVTGDIIVRAWRHLVLSPER